MLSTFLRGTGKGITWEVKRSQCGYWRVPSPTQLSASLSPPPEEGKIYSLVVNETQLDQPRSYTVQLALRKVSRCLPHLRVACMASNQSSTLYITGTLIPSAQRLVWAAKQPLGKAALGALFA